MRGKYKQGVYTIKNKEKYVGSATAKTEDSAIYRSSWEKIAFMYMDINPKIKFWGSEYIVVPYKYRLDRVQKTRRYYVDLFFIDDYGKHMVEIKPKYQTDYKRIKKAGNVNNIVAYIKNLDKWNYAQAYGKENGISFKIWTEEHIAELKKQLARYKMD